MTIEISKETEQSLETYLLESGLDKAAMSDVVEEAIENFLFRQMMRNAHERFAHLDPEATETRIEAAVREHRHKLPY